MNNQANLFKAEIHRLLSQPGIPDKLYYRLTRLATDRRWKT